MHTGRKDSEEILKALGAGDREIIEVIYSNHFAGLKRFVLANNGLLEDAEDLFQECIFYLYQYAREKEGWHVENLEAYFRAMYVNRWYYQLGKQKKQRQVQHGEIEHEVGFEDVYYYTYLKAFDKLGTDCKQVLTYYVEGKSTQEIATLLDTSGDYAKRKKYLCKEKLKKLAQSILKKSQDD